MALPLETASVIEHLPSVTVAVPAVSTEQPVHVRSRMRWALGIGFGFVIGWANSVCLLKYSAFPTMMTGNVFQLGFTMIVPTTKGKSDALLPDGVYYLMIILSYSWGAVFYRFSEIWLPTKSVFIGCVWAVLLFVFDVTGLDDMLPARWYVIVLAPIFAFQNGFTMRGGLNVPTAFLSGHLQNLSYGLVDRLAGKAGKSDWKNHVMSLAIMASIVAGASSGACCYRYLYKQGVAGIDKVELDKMSIGPLTPIAPLMFGLFLMHDRMFHPDSWHHRADRSVKSGSLEVELC